MNNAASILILGNGFDLAHGLPTTYVDFLKFGKWVTEFFESCKKQNLMGSKHADPSRLRNVLSESFQEYPVVPSLRTPLEDALALDFEGCAVSGEAKNVLYYAYQYLQNNLWLEYFWHLYSKSQMRGENWIDFESEMSFIIQLMDSLFPTISESCNLTTDIHNKHGKLSSFFVYVDSCLRSLHSQHKTLGGRPVAQSSKDATLYLIREVMMRDLKRLILALEIYFARFIDNLEIESERIPEIAEMSPDFVLNFNYTSTYTRVYGPCGATNNVQYIHGRACVDRSEKDNDMVLGIDEYWSDEKRNTHTNFELFRKFAQRIQKHTGSEYVSVLNDLKRNHEAAMQLYDYPSIGGDLEYETETSFCPGIANVAVFGHSLDITDRDVLSEFLGREYTRVRVYCKDENAEGALITTTVNLIGQDRLIEKANSTPPMLEYIRLDKRTSE